MGVLNFKQSKEVPQELPDLIFDEIEEELTFDLQNQGRHENSNSEIKTIEDYKVKGQEKDRILEAIDEEIGDEPVLQAEKKVSIVRGLPKALAQVPSPKESKIEEKSFFEEFQKKLEEEVSDLTSLENWCESKFSSQNMLKEMKSYWEKQKAPSLLESFGKNFKEKISEQIKKLQILEEDWQYTYFELIKKEDAIKDAEGELKQTVNEFIKVCKYKKNVLENEKIKTEENGKKETFKETEKE